eukprot:502547_1
MQKFVMTTTNEFWICSGCSLRNLDKNKKCIACFSKRSIKQTDAINDGPTSQFKILLTGALRSSYRDQYLEKIAWRNSDGQWVVDMSDKSIYLDVRDLSGLYKEKSENKVNIFTDHLGIIFMIDSSHRIALAKREITYLLGYKKRMNDNKPLAILTNKIDREKIFKKLLLDHDMCQRKKLIPICCNPIYGYQQKKHLKQLKINIEYAIDGYIRECMIVPNEIKSICSKYCGLFYNIFCYEKTHPVIEVFVSDATVDHQIFEWMMKAT